MREPDITESEQLIQRFVDQELSAEERLQFVARLGRDETLRHRAMDLERLVLDVKRLARPAVPDGFAARVLERTGGSRSFRHRVTDVLWAPHSLQWNLGGAAAAACLLAFAIGSGVAGALSWRTAFDPAASSVTTAPASSQVLVRLVVLQPGARTVQAAGDFNGWNPERTPLEQVSDGAWIATVPLEPGRYEYMFVVDGQHWIADPFATEQSNDGFGSHNAVLEIRPPSRSRS